MLINKVLEGVGWAILAQILSFYQMQGQFLFKFNKDNPWLMVVLGLPISYFFIKSVNAFVAAYNGEIWPSRLIGFGIGVTIFAIMSQLLFKEGISLKTITCLILGLGIILVQVFWKN